MRTVLLGLAIAALVPGCGVALRVGRPPEMVGSGTLEVPERSAARCVHGASGRDGLGTLEMATPTDPALAAVLDSLPAEVRRTARAAGLESLLARVLVERREATQRGTPTPELLALRDELSARMYAMETQLTAMEFEVDCVRGLINARLGDYAERETDRQLALTIASLAVGAAAGIAAGVWDLANSETADPAVPEGPLLVGIAGAIGTTALGTAVLVPAAQPIVYVHAHNVLGPIRRGSDDDMLFPSFVFRLLTLPAADGTSPTPRDELVRTWDAMIDEDLPADQRGLAELILFGAGGVYDPRLLTLHQALLEELGSTLDGLARDIDMLASAITVLLAADLPATPESPAE